MNKEAGVGKILGLTAAGIGAAGAGGAGGYFLGKRTGAEQMGTVMAKRFTQANAIENQQIARHYFLKGLSQNLKKGSSMNKQAVLDEIQNEAFNDELEKIAVTAQGVGGKLKAGISYLGQAMKSKANRGFGLSRGAYLKDSAANIGSAYAESAKGLYGGTKESIQKIVESLKKNPQHAWNKDPRLAAKALRGEAGKAAVGAGRKGALVLGTAGGVGVGGTGSYMIGRRKD